MPTGSSGSSASTGAQDRDGALVDTFGRLARDLRVSLTDHCNLRCTYCMPAEGLPWMAKPQMLTDEELLRVIGIFVELGVTQVRLTGASRSCGAACPTSSPGSPRCDPARESP